MRPWRCAPALLTALLWVEGGCARTTAKGRLCLCGHSYTPAAVCFDSANPLTLHRAVDSVHSMRSHRSRLHTLGIGAVLASSICMRVNVPCCVLRILHICLCTQTLL